jgi:DNA-binding NarL/FixJ family response regulator
MAADDPIRLVLVDDHTLFRQALGDLLRLSGGIQIVGEAGDGAEAVALCNRTRPDIVLLDAHLPGVRTTWTLGRIRTVSPGARVVIVSMLDDPDLIRELIGQGAHGYLLKTAQRQELLSAIRTVHSDGSRIVLSVSARSLATPHEAGNPLSQRERELLQLVAGALSNAQIATRLRITEGTVKRHLHNIFDKLGATSRLDAVNKAHRVGLIRRPSEHW